MKINIIKSYYQKLYTFRRWNNKSAICGISTNNANSKYQGHRNYKSSFTEQSAIRKSETCVNNGETNDKENNPTNLHSWVNILMK